MFLSAGQRLLIKAVTMNHTVLMGCWSRHHHWRELHTHRDWSRSSEPSPPDKFENSSANMRFPGIWEYDSTSFLVGFVQWTRSLFDHPNPTEYLSDPGRGAFLGVSSNRGTNILFSLKITLFYKKQGPIRRKGCVHAPPAPAGSAHDASHPDIQASQ
jgi:hypothetical protein